MSLPYRMNSGTFVATPIPWWMHTWWGRWLCNNWRPAMVLHRTLVASAQVEACQADVVWCAELVLGSIERCIRSGYDEADCFVLKQNYRRWEQAIRSENEAVGRLQFDP
jgi:hypothetical protein